MQSQIGPTSISYASMDVEFDSVADIHIIIDEHPHRGFVVVDQMSVSPRAIQNHFDNIWDARAYVSTMTLGLTTLGLIVQVHDKALEKGFDEPSILALTKDMVEPEPSLPTPTFWRKAERVIHRFFGG